jgi:hypothetical protein
MGPGRHTHFFGRWVVALQFRCKPTSNRDLLGSCLVWKVTPGKRLLLCEFSVLSMTILCDARRCVATTYSACPPCCLTAPRRPLAAVSGGNGLRRSLGGLALFYPLFPTDVLLEAHGSTSSEGSLSSFLVSVTCSSLYAKIHAIPTENIVVTMQNV